MNVDQCVSTTMEDAYFRDYGAVLLADATATSSPAYCKEAVIFNAKQCWGFVTTTERFAAPDPYPAGRAERRGPSRAVVAVHRPVGDWGYTAVMAGVFLLLTGPC